MTAKQMADFVTATTNVLISYKAATPTVTLQDLEKYLWTDFISEAVVEFFDITTSFIDVDIRSDLLAQIFTLMKNGKLPSPEIILTEEKKKKTMREILSNPRKRSAL